MIKLYRGSIFTSKCDLIVIPCNNNGGVTNSVRTEIILNNLPYLYEKIPAGDVRFLQNIGKFANASMICYAASVDVKASKSNEEMIASIAKKIKECCLEQSFTKINIPLLGAGAGKMSPQQSFEIIKSVFEEDTQIEACVYVISTDTYNLLRNIKQHPSRVELQNPRVFLSYTGTNPKNREWVKAFAGRLRSCGVNARLDIYHLKPGQDLPQWMTNELIMANKVLLICDQYYAEKADNRTGGVGWETMIIQGDMLSNQNQNKYVAILRDSNIDQTLPLYVKSKYAFHWADNAQYEQEFNNLLLYLFDCENEPPIGDIPDFIKEKLVQPL